jgi:hypothetical protein
VKNSIIGLALLLAAFPCPAQEKPSGQFATSCSESDFSAAAGKLQAARAALLALPVGDGLETGVSPEGQKAISAMKESLGEFVNAYLRCAPTSPDTGRVRRELSESAHAFRLPNGVTSNKDLPPDFGKYGFELWFGVQSAHDNRLLSITATFSIECGTDAVLFIFSRDGGSWHEALRWQSRPYASIKDAFGSFGSGISPPDNLGRWYVVTKHKAPWCTSTWSTISYDALRPQAGSVIPTVLLLRHDSIWLGNDDIGSLTVNVKDFDVRFHSASIDGGVHNRLWIRHFSISGDTVARVQPVAASPRDFVDEWIVSPWESASGWTSKAASEQLRLAHENFPNRRKSFADSLGFGTIYKCSGARDHYQVELMEETGPKFDIDRSFYFQVVGKHAYTMTGVSSNPDPRCTGRNLFDEMSTK